MIVARLCGWSWSVGPSVCQSDGQVVGPPLWCRLTHLNSYGWIAMKFCTDIYDPLRMNPTDFSSCATMRLTFLVISEIYSQLLDGQYQDPETEAAKWNSAIIHFIIYTCAFPTATHKNIFCEKGLLVSALIINNLLTASEKQ